ncbi:MAG: NTP transferase domain-containing protein [Spirochaetales bacterium]|nr:NTP transferase domain-containing protein [Spirochaetales bacterium]
MTGVFLQVRLDSRRLPEKALAELGGLTLLERCCRALNPIPCRVKAVLTEPGSADRLRPLVDSCGWKLFVGPKEDVLTRFTLAAQELGVSRIVRATGDNPLVNATLATLMLNDPQAAVSAYAAWQGAPLGTGVEILQTSALLDARSSNPTLEEQEHVAPHLYHHPERFAPYRPEVPTSWRSSGRVTVDTLEDLAWVRTLWQALGTSAYEIETLVGWLETHPR